MGPDTKKALIIINSSAGIGKAPADEQIIVDRFASQGYETRVFHIYSDADLISDMKIPVDDAPDIVISCGGDGTFNRTTNTILKQSPQTVLAYVPFGNTDSFARSLGIPAGRDSALNTVFNGKLYKCDTGRLNDSYFNFVASFAPASVMQYVTCQQMKGVFEYAKHILRAIGELNMNMGNGFDISIGSDKGTVEGSFIFGAVSNLSAIDGINLSNDSFGNNDGIMELLMIKTPESRDEALEALNVIREGSLDHPLISTSLISNGSFVSGTDIAWSLDGEFGGIHKEAKLEVIRESLKVMTP